MRSKYFFLSAKNVIHSPAAETNGGPGISPKEPQILARAGSIFLIGGILALAIMPISVLSPVLMLLLGITLGILIVFVLVPDDFNFLLNVYLIGFAVRAFLSFFFYIVSFVLKSNYSPGFIFPNDGWCYSVQGWQIYKFAERGIKITAETFMVDPNMKDYILSGNITPYDFFTSHVYSITGYSPLALFFISSIASSIAALFIYLIAKELFSKRVARISALFAFFWPSFILWSTQNLKEPMIAMFIFILLWSIFYMRRYINPGFLLLSALSVWALLKIGFPFIVIVGCMSSFAVLFLFINFLIRDKLITVVIIGLLFAVFIFLFKDVIWEQLLEKSVYNIKSYGSMFEFLNYHRSVRAYGNLQLFKNIDISSVDKTLVFAPLGLVFALFAPFPWQLGSIMQAIAAPETLMFYILFPCTLKGIIFGYKKRFNQSLILLLVIIGILCFLALVEGNSGTLFRHRCIAFYLLFIFTSTGLDLKKWKLKLSI